MTMNGTLQNENKLVGTLSSGSAMSGGLGTVIARDGKDGKDGEPGKDGVSVTHSWNGTTLTVTSASGTSSADLKGEPGKDGQPGKDGSDGYTPIKGKDYNDGEPGVRGEPGQDGRDGFSPVVSVSKVGKVTTITITDKNGTKTATIHDGEDGTGGGGGGTGEDGKDGIGIASIVQTTKSSADDGINIITITLTDGSTHTFEVQNGSKGSTGAAGANGSNGKDGVSATHSWSGTTLTVTSASGTSSANLKGDDGEPGADGVRGTGILKINTSPSSASGTGTNGVAIKYKIALSTLKSEAGVSEVFVGDVVLRSYYIYQVVSVDASYAYLSAYTSIRGATGSAGAAGKDGADGNPGVYIGSGDMPDGYSVQIDPNGDPFSFEEIVEDAADRAIDVLRESANVRIGEVALPASAWNGTDSPYWQIVSIATVTTNTQVDLTPSAAQLSVFHHKDLAFVTENEDGVVTVYAIGQKPENDYTIQVTMTEVIV